eukprot:CAMPEP_0185404732 /NCGR_PEP_ID=MMETSP1364-20130426/92942_1 /TAXON_ID=38817 /ORGANISM="Gephyrocapsa oceanica, Strain RCC1303" /LENGTH=163 /DNA_ID=CAMNT_0028007031 /DNA_START=541 /DNA_END=1033 /DNA_ORIENTATION=-
MTAALDWVSGQVAVGVEQQHIESALEEGLQSVGFVSWALAQPQSWITEPERHRVDSLHQNGCGRNGGVMRIGSMFGLQNSGTSSWTYTTTHGKAPSRVAAAANLCIAGMYRLLPVVTTTVPFLAAMLNRCPSSSRGPTGAEAAAMEHSALWWWRKPGGIPTVV